MKKQRIKRLIAMFLSVSMVLESGVRMSFADTVDSITEILDLENEDTNIEATDDNDIEIISDESEDYDADCLLEEDSDVLFDESVSNDVLIEYEERETEEADERYEEFIYQSAAGSTNVDGIHSWSGSCGDNLTWSLSGGVLTIRGTGEMYDYENPGVAPWGYGKLWEYADINAIYINEGVTSIGTWCFARHTELTFVSLPDTLREIHQNAFAGCSSLAVPSWPKGLKYLSEKAFDGCTSFENVILPEGLEYVGDKAFWYCENLKHLKLPSTLKTFYGSNFVMTALRTIGPVGEGYDVEIPWETEIPEGIEFGYYGGWPETGYFSPIEQVCFPHKMTSISIDICHNMDRLTDIVFPDSLIEIEPGAFQSCDSLTELDLSGYQKLQVIECEAFCDCKNLEIVRLPDQATFDEYGRVFMGCSSLYLIHLPETLTFIPDGLFWGCEALTEDSFNWPAAGLTQIGQDAFRECRSLTKITLPDSVEKIQHGAFVDCENLTSVTIPAGCTEFHLYGEERGIFTGCTHLTSAGPIGDGKTYSIRYGWTENIPNCAFAVSEIKTVSFPSTLKEIGYRAFEYCDNLKAVVLPETLTKIGEYAFGSCKSLTTVRLPKSLKIIGNYAFEDCPNLSRILFRGDMPIPGAYLGAGIFRNDIITAYYPANNPTWKQEELDEYWYGDDVTWKPYNGNDNPDLRREREASLNHAGIVKARFYLIDENGETMPEVSFRYTRHYNGIREEFDSAELVTDLDGSYVFQTPYLTGDNVSHEIVFDDFEIVSEEDVSLLPDLAFKLDVVTEPFLYTEAWSLALGRNGEFFNVATSSHANSAKIELAHKAGGAMDLTLSITLTEGLAAKMNDKLGKSEFGEDDRLGISVLSTSVSTKSEKAVTYKKTITDYSPGNASHQEIVSNYLALVMLADYLAAMNDGTPKSVLFQGLIVKCLESKSVVNFNAYEETIKAKVTASSSVLNFTDTKTKALLGSLQVGALNDEANYSYSLGTNELGQTTWKTGLKAERFFSVISGLTTGLAGVRGLGGGLKVNDVSASVSSMGSVSVSSCNYDSGVVDAVGWGDVYQYHTLTAQDESAKEISNSSSVLRTLKNGDPTMITPSAWGSIQEAFAESTGTVYWKDTEKLTNTYTWNPQFQIIKKILSIGANFTWTHEWNAEVESGEFRNGVVILTADSSSEILRRVQNLENATDLKTIISSPSNQLSETLSTAAQIATSSFGGLVINKQARLLTNTGKNTAWQASIIGIADNKTTLQTNSARKMSFVISTFPAGAGVTSFSTAAEAVEAKTIGDAYEIIITDEDGNTRDKLDEGDSAELTLSYTNDLLTSAASQADRLAIYRLDEEGGYYNYVGGVVNTEDCTVTAEIEEPGQYVLAANGAGVTVSDISVDDGEELRAIIRSFAGIQSAKLILDGECILSTESGSFWRYYDNKTGIFEYYDWFDDGDHELLFQITDGTGALSEIPYTFSVQDAPEIRSVQVDSECYYGGKIAVQAIVDTNDEAGLSVWAEVMLEGAREDRTESCLMEKQGDIWVLSYPVKRGYSSYSFEIYARDSYGEENFSWHRTSNVTMIGTFDIDGMIIRFNQKRGEILYIWTEESEIALPADIRGIKVTSIASGACETCSLLKKVTVPSSITNIGERALGYVKVDSGNLIQLVPVDDFKIVADSDSAAAAYFETFQEVAKQEQKHDNTANSGHSNNNSSGNSSSNSGNGGTANTTVSKPQFITNVAKATITGLSDKTYTGKALKPLPVVKLNGTTLKNGTDFTVTYRNNKAVGMASITIKGKGKYNGMVQKTFRILPKATTVSKLTAGKKKLTVKWKKQATQTSGYQIQYSTNKSFKKKVKTKNVSGAKKTSVSLTKLSAKTTYYVRIRTYRKVGKTIYYSSWSKVKSKKTK